MEGMSESRAAGAPFALSFRAIAVLALTLLLAFAVLSSHHDEDAATVAPVSHSAAPSSDPGATEAAVALAGGCALLVVCCLLALTVLRRFWRATLVAADRQAVPAAHFPRLTAAQTIPQPSLLQLSVNRT